MKKVVALVSLLLPIWLFFQFAPLLLGVATNMVGLAVFLLIIAAIVYGYVKLFKWAFKK